MTHTRRTHKPLAIDTARQELERQLHERLNILAGLAPRALPSVDPVAYQTAESNRIVVKQITDALNRLDTGTYGVCIRCGSNIARARLEVMPHVAACIDCQTRAEAA